MTKLVRTINSKTPKKASQWQDPVLPRQAPGALSLKLWILSVTVSLSALPRVPRTIGFNNGKNVPIWINRSFLALTLCDCRVLRTPLQAVWSRGTTRRIERTMQLTPGDTFPRRSCLISLAGEAASINILKVSITPTMCTARWKVTTRFLPQNPTGFNLQSNALPVGPKKFRITMTDRTNKKSSVTIGKTPWNIPFINKTLKSASTIVVIRYRLLNKQVVVTSMMIQSTPANGLKRRTGEPCGIHKATVLT